MGIDVGINADINAVLDGRAVTSVFQPLIGLADNRVVGYEALSRGPVGSELEGPMQLFAAAAAVGRQAELDWICRASAYRAALEAELHPSLSLFVNTEPAALGSPCPADLQPLVTRAEGRLRVVAELTERGLAHHPERLLAAVAGARAVGWGVALDDVGAEPESLALMPFVHPDVVKLDLRLIQDRTSRAAARIVNAAQAYAERFGATLLAEGIETERHLRVAQSMGATVGQGWYFGRPGPLIPRQERPGPPIELLLGPPIDHQPTPYEIVSATRPSRRSTKELLLPMSHYLEDKALDAAEPAVLIACFQDEVFFTPFTRVRFQRIRERAAFVAALGRGMASNPDPGIRGADLADDDRLRDEWNVLVVGPHFAGALVARECPGGSPQDGDREFDFVLTHDRDLVVAAARTVLGRLAPAQVLEPAVAAS